MIREITRRRFVQAAAAGAGLAVIHPLWTHAQSTQPASTQSNTLNVAIIGIGKQGRILLTDLFKVPNVRIQAICDIWSYGRKIGLGVCKSQKVTPAVYEDYREMLATEKGLDAVFIATPDFWHAPMTVDCLKQGLHVYCEKAMSNTLEGAASMVKTARATGKLLQIGQQRRSSPFYRQALKFINRDRFCGTIYMINGQWNQLKRVRSLPAAMIRKYPMTESLLNKWGYGSYTEFYEWRWFKRYSHGPMTDLGIHQVDIYNWFLGAYPTRVTAFGGLERALAEAKKEQVGFLPECFDHTLCVYEWQLDDRTVLGHYQVNLNSSDDGYYEKFEGNEGTIVTSEIRDKMRMLREIPYNTPIWVSEAGATETRRYIDDDSLRDEEQLPARRKERELLEKQMVEAASWPHLPHIKNFLAAISGAEKLNCPGEIGYAALVTALKAEEAAITGKRIEFHPADFQV